MLRCVGYSIPLAKMLRSETRDIHLGLFIFEEQGCDIGAKG
jgi:hypothetical protein